MAKHKISDSRKGLYYGGMVITFIGMLLFLSTFVRVIFGFSGNGMEMPSMGSFMGPPLIGMFLTVSGGMMRNVGLKGTAGSGMILDPDKARDDLKPWTEMAGGMVSDVLGEVHHEPQENTKVKIRCRHCKTLNEEDAKFCKSCGEPI